MKPFLYLLWIPLLFGQSPISYPNYIPYPIQYSIPASKVVKQIPTKTRDFAVYRPGQPYLYTNEEDYYRGYQDAFFAITCKKQGWDSLRHYEILANGCIPYFVGLEDCPDSNTLHFLPKKLILEAMRLEGVSYPSLSIDKEKFDFKRYYEILEELLEHTRAHLTSEKMADYLLQTVNYRGQGKVLFLSADCQPEYLRDTILIGLKDLLGDRVVDVPKIEYIYRPYGGDPKNLYGLGMTYTKVVADLAVDRSSLAQRIARREFDLIVYGEMHKGLFLFYDLVKQHYRDDEIVYLYCEEVAPAANFHLPNVFMREHYLFNSARSTCIDPGGRARLVE